MVSSRCEQLVLLATRCSAWEHSLQMSGRAASWCFFQQVCLRKRCVTALPEINKDRVVRGRLLTVVQVRQLVFVSLGLLAVWVLKSLLSVRQSARIISDAIVTEPAFADACAGRCLHLGVRVPCPLAQLQRRFYRALRRATAAQARHGSCILRMSV